jgi:ABC-2 type transport system permease protein
MKKILALMQKEFSHLRRDRKSIIIIFVMPIVQLAILGFAANLDVRALSMMVVDQDRTQASRKLVEGFTATEYFAVQAQSSNINDIDRAINQGDVSLALVIPVDFEKDLLNGRPTSVEAIFDGTESYTANVGIGYAQIIIARYSEKILVSAALKNPRTGLREPVLDVRTRVWFNPELQSRKFLIPGILAMLVMLVTILLTSLAIVKEKELGTLEQLIVTPIRPSELIVGKLMPFFIIGLADLTLITIEAFLVFGTVMVGSILLYYFFSVFFILTTLGIGFLVSTISKNQQQAMLASIFFFILPMILLGGFVFPINNMPVSIQFFTYFLPLRYFFVIIRGIFLKGAGFLELWDELLALVILAVVLYGLAILRFRKRLD